MLFTAFVFIAVLSLLVFVHELGHFAAARKFGARAEEFGFGFPPRVFGMYKDKSGKWQKVFGNKEVADASDTIYSANLFPLGGFVKIKGENGDSVAEPDSFASKKIWQRVVILSAGVAMNVVLAMFLFSVGYMVGLPQMLSDTTNDPNAIIEDRRIQISETLKDSIAQKNGFKRGDIILSINDKKFENYDELKDFVSSNEGKKLSYEIKRGQDVLILEATPEKLQNSDHAGIGIAIAQTATVSYPWYLAIFHGVKYTILLIWMIIVAFIEFFKNLIFGSGVAQEVAGPVGIASMTGEMARLGFMYVLQFTAMLSANLAVINFLPFPALDGGRVVFLIIEKIKGSPIKQEHEAMAHSIGFALLIILIIFVTYKDIVKI